MTVRASPGLSVALLAVCGAALLSSATVFVQAAGKPGPTLRQCAGITQKGERCRNRELRALRNQFCFLHQPSRAKRQ